MKFANLAIWPLFANSTPSFGIDSQAEKLYTILGNQITTTNTTIVRQYQGDHELGAYIIHHNATELPIEYIASLPKQHEDNEISERASIIYVGAKLIGASLVFTIEIGPLGYITGGAILAFFACKWFKGGQKGEADQPENRSLYYYKRQGARGNIQFKWNDDNNHVPNQDQNRDSNAISACSKLIHDKGVSAGDCAVTFNMASGNSHKTHIGLGHDNYYAADPA